MTLLLLVLATLPTLGMHLQYVMKCLATFIHKQKHCIQPPRPNKDKFHLQVSR